MSRNHRVRKHERSALRPECERLERLALLSGAGAAVERPPVRVAVGMVALSPFFFQQSSSAQITLTRSSGQGTLAVEFSTTADAAPESLPGKTIPDAMPGQEYLPVDETVTFQPGQTALVVSVPIVANAANPGIVMVEMTTMPLVTGGAAETGDFAIVSGADQLPLIITRAQIVTQASGASAIALTFNEPLAPPSVESLQNYRITPTGRSVAVSRVSGSRKPTSPNGSKSSVSPVGALAASDTPAAGTVLSLVGATSKNSSPTVPMRVQSVSYDATTNTVTLLTAKPLNLSQIYQVVIGSGVGTSGIRKHKHGAALGVLTSQAGNSLAPDSPVGLDVTSGGNLVDLTAAPFLGFNAIPVSFNVSSRSSGPPQLAQYTRPLNIPTNYNFEL